VANRVRTISKGRIGRVLGRQSDREGPALDRALRIQLAL
jgi:hypothetical protein